MRALSYSNWPQNRQHREQVQRAVKERWPAVWRRFKGQRAIPNPPQQIEYSPEQLREINREIRRLGEIQQRAFQEGAIFDAEELAYDISALHREYDEIATELYVQDSPQDSGDPRW